MAQYGCQYNSYMLVETQFGPGGTAVGQTQYFKPPFIGYKWITFGDLSPIPTSDQMDNLDK